MTGSFFCFILFYLLLAPAPLQSQDNVILPDVQLSIGDQSSVKAGDTAEALLKDRSPVFDQVYLEELNPAPGLPRRDTDARILYLPLQQRDITSFQFLYGHYHQTDATARFRRSRGVLTTDIIYRGFSRQYASTAGAHFPQSSMLTNGLDFILTASLARTRIEGHFAYRQDELSFNAPFARKGHYAPFGLGLKHWLSETSFLTAEAEGRIFALRHENRQGAELRSQLLGDVRAALAYEASFVPWNILRFELSSTATIGGLADHDTLITLLSEFTLGKGLSLTAGFALAPHTQFFGWPEIALRYAYGDLFRLSLSLGGDFRTVTARDAFNGIQVFAAPAVDSRWITRLAIQGKGGELLSYGAYVQLNSWNSRRDYAYNGEYYTIVQGGGYQSLAAGLNFSLSYGGIADFGISYDFETVPGGRLLIAPHNFSVALGLGWVPSGFRFESLLKFAGFQNFGNGTESLYTRWDLKLSQRIYKEIALTLEFLNILNTDTFVWADLTEGGFQARGGIRMNF